jgi:hypothetical protein
MSGSAGEYGSVRLTCLNAIPLRALVMSCPAPSGVVRRHVATTLRGQLALAGTPPTNNPPRLGLLPFRRTGRRTASPRSERPKQTRRAS